MRCGRTPASGENKLNFPGFIVLSPKKKVFATGLHALAHVYIGHCKQLLLHG